MKRSKCIEIMHRVIDPMVDSVGISINDFPATVDEIIALLEQKETDDASIYVHLKDSISSSVIIILDLDDNLRYNIGHITDELGELMEASNCLYYNDFDPE